MHFDAKKGPRFKLWLRVHFPHLVHENHFFDQQWILGLPSMVVFTSSYTHMHFHAKKLEELWCSWSYIFSTWYNRITFSPNHDNSAECQWLLLHLLLLTCIFMRKKSKNNIVHASTFSAPCTLKSLFWPTLRTWWTVNGCMSIYLPSPMFICIWCQLKKTVFFFESSRFAFLL